MLTKLLDWGPDNCLLTKYFFYVRNNSRVNREHECALQKNLNHRFFNRFISTFEYKNTIYRRKKDIVNDFTKFENLNFTYFQMMFNCGFCFYMLLFLIFLMQKLFRKLKIICRTIFLGQFAILWITD